MPIRTRLKIRTACPDDAAVIAKILAETFAEYKSLYTPKAFAVMTPGKDEIERRFTEAGEIWVAALDGEIIGTVSAVQRGEALYHSQSGNSACRAGFANRRAIVEGN